MGLKPLALASHECLESDSTWDEIPLSVLRIQDYPLLKRQVLWKATRLEEGRLVKEMFASVRVGSHNLNPKFLGKSKNGSEP